MTVAIIVDEAPMTHRTAYEAVDRTLRDIRGVDAPIGGIPSLMCDFGQIQTNGSEIENHMKKIYKNKTNI